MARATRPGMPVHEACVIAHRRLRNLVCERYSADHCYQRMALDVMYTARERLERTLSRSAYYIVTLSSCSVELITFPCVRVRFWAAVCRGGTVMKGYLNTCKLSDTHAPGAPERTRCRTGGIQLKIIEERGRPRWKARYFLKWV